MRTSLVAVTFLIILINLAEQRAALEDDNPDYLKDNYDDPINLAITESWEENAETTLADESNFKDNESVEESDPITLRYSLPKRDEFETKQPQILDPDECGDPPSVKNAMIFEGKQIRYEVGAKVTYACEFGYITDGSVHSSECHLTDVTQTLYWTEPRTRCSPRSCGDPGYVAHAHRVGSVFTFPNKISFDCDEGYVLRGYGIRYCQTSGTWSGNLPTCEPIYCNPPENPENGKVSYSSLGFESELHYECDPGFILKNDQGRTCSGNGTWTGNEPICQEAQCDPPVAPKHGTVQIIGDKSSVGSRALYTCDEGRVLYGSASSRCLDIGEWTFPTPKCLEPCFVPKLEHGKIGRYVRSYRWRERTFEELTENSNIEDGEELYLRCEPNYEPFGKPETEEKISCAQGEWKAVPVCEPARCRDLPPPTKNARVARANRTHGGGVVYKCREFSKKEKYGNVTCVFGTWKGVTPVCKDLRCYVDELSFPGLKKGSKKSYLPNQLFTVSCEFGFNITKENNQLKCVDGTWQGHLPPCISASCNPGDLAESQGIVLDDQKMVLNGEYLNVRCGEGYSPSGEQARCSRGQWNVRGKLCQESSCTLHKIDNGGFSERVEKTKLTWRLTYDRWYEYSRLQLGGTRRSGSLVYVSCDERYTFQGKRENDVPVKCSKGKWDPDPICLIAGTTYRNEAGVSLEKAEKSNTTTNTLANRSASTTKQPFIFTTQSRTAEPDEILDNHENLHPTPYPSCSCTYRSVDDNLVAFEGTKELSYGSKVKNNGKIKFHCKHFGYSRLNGASEIKCEKCHSWHSSEFPECVAPHRGDTILQFEGDYSILPGGIIGVAEGGQLTIRCTSNVIKELPEWFTNIPETLLYSGYTDGYGRQVSVLIISNLGSQHTGQYICRTPGYRSSVFDIQVISTRSVNCSKFDDTHYIIHYDKEQAINSTAMFYCKDRSKKSDGPNILTCLSNGQWSGDPPECKSTRSVNCSKFDDTHYIIHYGKEQAINSTAAFLCKDRLKKLDGPNVVTCLSNGQWSGGPPECKTTCPIIVETEGMTISYTNGLDKGSIAAFHCLMPRTRSGVPRTTCKSNGEWSDPPAKCTLSSCSLEKLFEVVPENVVPVMEGVASDTLPYNFSLRLTCENNMVLSGLDIAKCGQNGMWQVSQVQCISGCGLPKSENSELVIEPDKRFYRFGESVSISCSPGYILNSEVVRLMCLGTSWSESVPECIKEEKEKIF